MSAGHTKGPWHVRTLENFGFNVVHYAGGDKHNIVRVAKACDEANARLIAASPDMLDALQGIRSMLSGYEGQPNFNGDIYKITDAAVARATGEQP